MYIVKHLVNYAFLDVCMIWFELEAHDQRPSNPKDAKKATNFSVVSSNSRRAIPNMCLRCPGGWLASRITPYP